MNHLAVFALAVTFCQNVASAQTANKLRKRASHRQRLVEVSTDRAEGTFL